MKCPKCQAENPETKQFCADCGTQLGPASGIRGHVPDSPESDTCPQNSKDFHPGATETLQAPIHELTTGSTFANRYQIIEELGKGGMGRVYRALDKKLNEEVALKLIKSEIALDKKTLERFGNELRIARKIIHKNIGRMYELLEDRGYHFITMEYVSGQDLRGLIKQTGQLMTGKAVFIAKQICDGLAEAHRLGIVHRDLKPSNIMIDKEGDARIMDFGIARSLRTKGLTGEGVIIGTPEYMSPEQVEGKEVDQRSDIYSLGIILYEMLTGQVPFEGDTPLAIAVKHKTEVPRDPQLVNAQIPQDLSRVVLKCLEKDKEKRYQSADELHLEFEKIEKGIPTTERVMTGRKPFTSKEITVKFSLKKLLVPGLVVAALVVAAILIIWRVIPQKAATPAKLANSSIAVLPFEDLSPAKDQAFLCDGFSESLINALTKIKDLRVPARTSSFSFKGKDLSLPEIGERLNIETVLEGSLQRVGDELRITVKLVNVSDESVQWSEQYKRKLDDVFSIQDEITLNVVEELKVRLAGGERAELTKRTTTSAEAYQLYLQGRHFRWLENKVNFLKARDYFEQAIEKDPNYSSAWAGLADTYMLLGLFSMMPRAEAAQKAGNAARKALELDANSSEAHTSLGVILEVFDWDWEEAEREFKRAIALNPNHFDAPYEYGLLLSRLKRLDEAQAELEKSLHIDPLSSRAYSGLDMVYTLKGDLEKAKEQNRKSEELGPQAVGGENAVERAQKLIDRDGRLPPHLISLARAYMQSGQEAEARRLIDELQRLYEESDIGNIALGVAQVYLNLDDKDQAIRWLERAYERRDPLLVAINTWTSWDPLRQDPKFKSILLKMGLER